MRQKLWFASILLTVVLVAGCVSQASGESKTTPVQTATPSQQITQSGLVSGLETTVESIYAQVNPSVVNIQVWVPSQGITSLFPPSHPDVSPTPGAPQLSRALASGVVWDTQGRIVTNNHVVDGATRMTVTFSDGTTVDATLVGADPDSDLAVIKVDPSAEPLHPVKVADSNQVKVGQLAIAIGNPFGLQGTMTVGFISGLGRVLPANSNALGGFSIPDIIQTDASINPGNSGGALLDSSGNLIGVNFAIDTNSGTSSGVGFAIPTSLIQQVIPELITNGHYDHPWLGIGIVSMNPDLAAAMNLPSNQRGILVSTVTAGSPADKAGLQASQNQVTINGVSVKVGGDVITAFNGQGLKTTDDLISLLARSGVVGQSVTLTVLRGGKETPVQITLSARPTS